MKRFLKEHKWFSVMVVGIALLASTVINGELFYGQTVVASILIIFALMLDGAETK